jgi:hypothetical protein
MATSPKVTNADSQAITVEAALASAPGGAEAPGVDKIRELLFGNQMQDYERRFLVIEDRFQQKMRDLEGASTRNLASVESTFKKQLDSVVAQLRQEQELRADADKETGRGLRELIEALEKRLSQVSDRVATMEREFTERVEHESQLLRDEIRRRNDDTRATIERMFSELTNVKTDRNLLAGLFVEIARCLNQDVTSKGSRAIGIERS